MSRQFLLDEEQALRNLLTGITVDDQRQGSRRVGVWFGQPDLEVRTQSYPYITINNVGIAEDKARAMRGRCAPEYDRPEGARDNGWDMDWPTPINLDYQVTTFARQPRHDRQLMAALLSNDRLPLRFAVLFPDDGTVRRIDVLGIAKRDTTEDGKRLFQNAITVRIPSELPPPSTEMYEQVANRFITFGLTIPTLTGP
jgi:hypothetical protein